MSLLFKFIVDDYGIDQKTERETLKLVENGPVRHISVFANAELVDSKAITRINRNISWGAHLYLSEHIMLSPKMRDISLEKEGLNKKDLLLYWIQGKISYAEIYKEFDTQIYFLRKVGIPISYLDTHQNVHGIPFIFRIIQSISEKYNLQNRIRPIAQMRFYSKIDIWTVFSVIYSNLTRFKPYSRVLVGCPGYGEKEINLDNAITLWDRFLRKVGKKWKEGIYVPCHPGVSPAETELYLSSEFIDLLRNHNIRLE